MVSEKTIMNSFERVTAESYGARFYRTDLHFHTPASEDARTKKEIHKRKRDIYTWNLYDEVFPEKNNNPGEYYKKVREIQQRIERKSRELAAEMVKGFVEKKVRLVAVTDHNGIGTIWNDPEADKKIMDLAAPTWYELIDDEAQEVNNREGKTLLTILPGVEISTTGVHILAVFPPQVPRREIHFIICDLLNDVGFDIKEWGKNPKVGKASIYNTIELIAAKGGIPIIAHADGSDQAILKLYRIDSGAMRDVFTNKHLNAIEIVDPENLEKYNRKVKKPLSTWIKKLRKDRGLEDFAYFRGSDAHGLKDIACRSSYVKMTEPSFTGLKIALCIPSSRVRFYRDVQDLIIQEEKKGLYVYGIEINHPYFGKRCIRFNRHLNCAAGKLDSGKSTLFKLMQQPITPADHNRDIQGSVKLFIEKIEESQSHYYAIGRDSRGHYFYSLDKSGDTANKLDWGQLKDLHIIPHFYDPDIADPWISSGEEFNKFLEERFGAPGAKSIETFNETFDIPIFLEEKNQRLLYAELHENQYKIYLNVRWNRGKEKRVEFEKLDNSLRRIVFICIMLISGTAGPLIIDAPEAYFNNEDIINYLVPIIKKYKDTRQIILFTNHPLLAINTDPENYILLEQVKRKGKKINRVESGFSIDKEGQRDKLINLMEGNLGAFNKRKIRYELE